MLGSTLAGKNVLVTGGAGLIGSHLVDRLVEAGANVTVLDSLASGHRDNLNPHANFQSSDVRDYDGAKTVASGKDLMFLLAGSVSTKWDDPVADCETNILGTLNYLRAASAQTTPPSVVFVSSAAVYGIPEHVPTGEDHPTRPISPYGVSKLTGEKYCYAYHREFGLDVKVLRFFSVYGPRQRQYVMYDLLQKLAHDPDNLEVLGDGRQIRDYCYVSDAVDALILMAEKGPPGGVLNVASGKPISIRDLVTQLVAVMGLTDRTEVRYTGQSWRGDIPTLLGDATAMRQLGFEARISLEEGLRHLRDWLSESPEQPS